MLVQPDIVHGMRDSAMAYHADAVAAHVSTLPAGQRALLLRNPAPGDEPADSLQWGLRSLTSMPERLLVLLGRLASFGADGLRRRIIPLRLADVVGELALVAVAARTLQEEVAEARGVSRARRRREFLLRSK